MTDPAALGLTMIQPRLAVRAETTLAEVGAALANILADVKLALVAAYGIGTKPPAPQEVPWRYTAQPDGSLVIAFTIVMKLPDGGAAFWAEVDRKAKAEAFMRATAAEQ